LNIRRRDAHARQALQHLVNAAIRAAREMNP